jgi:hypothetical protein
MLQLDGRLAWSCSSYVDKWTTAAPLAVRGVLVKVPVVVEGRRRRKLHVHVEKLHALRPD